MSFTPENAHMAKPPQYSVKMQGPGISLDRTVDEEIAQQIAALVLGIARNRSPTPALEETEAPTTDRGDASRKSLSLREFFNEHGPKRNPEKIVVIAEYLRIYRQQDTVTRSTLATGFDEARESIPRNLSRDITWTVKIGWLANKENDSDVYQLTTSGMEAVAKKFPPELRAKTKVSMGGKKRKRVAKQP
jgi:hypothetical protein